MVFQEGIKFRAAFAKLFFRVPSGNIFAFLQPIAKRGEMQFAAGDLERCLIQADAIKGAYPYFVAGNLYHAMASPDFYPHGAVA